MNGYIISAKAALKAGRGDEALAWADKAVQVNPDPVALEFESLGGMPKRMSGLRQCHAMP